MNDTVLTVTPAEPDGANQGVPLAELLQISARDVRELLASHFRGHAQRVVPGPVLDLLAEDAAAAVSKGLQVDGLGLALKAWAAIRELQEYTDPRKHAPGETSVVRWGHCSITAPQGFALGLKVLGVELPALRFTIDLQAEFDSLALSIRDGAVQQVSPGPAKVSVSLKCGKQTIVDECSTPELTFKRGVRFDPPLPIGWKHQPAAGA